MQVIFRATTSTTVAYGTAVTSLNVQVLPAWAPPIQYIGTTTPWLVQVLNSTTALAGGGTTVVGAFIGNSRGFVKTAHVRTYGRKSNLHSGVEVICIRNRVKTTATKKPLLVVTYRAVGELVRP